MCQQCIDVAKDLFGEMNDETVKSLFWNATSYPAGTHEEVKRQLQNHYNNGARTAKEAISLAMDDLTRIMEQPIKPD